MTEAQEAAVETARAQAADGGPQAGGGIGRAAVLIGAITIVSNIVGFARQLVFAHTVSATCLGTAYATANQVPNIIYDIVLGGALTSVLIPVLAGPAARRLAGRAPGAGAAGTAPDSAETQAGQISSAMLTWTVLVLGPVSIIVAVAAGPLASLLLAGAPRCAHAAIVGVSSRMLVVFAPQILLYGLAVVLYGILQAHRRFTAPALAPVLSSLVVISAYLAFVPLSHGYGRLASLPRSAELMLSVGTTAGVAALVLAALIPALRLRLRLRPTLRFPAGVAPRIRGLAGVGLIALIAQDASVVAVMLLANGQEGQGALVLYNFGWQMFFVPYAVLAVPIATTAFPVLAAAEGPRFDETAAASTRAVMLVSCLGAALLAGAAVPAARLFTHHPGDARQLAYTFAAFAPGLIGYGLATHLSRVLFADARTRVAGVALVAGWLLVIAADVVAVALVPDWWVVPVLGLGNTIGMTASGLALLGSGAPGARPGRAARGVPGGPGRAGRGRGRGGRGGRAILRRAGPRLHPQRRACPAGLRVRDARVRRGGAGPGRGGPARGAGPRPGHAAGGPAGRDEAAAVTGAASPAGTAAPDGLRVSYLMATTAGGTGRHVAMLAGGCAARGATVHVYGPAGAGTWLARARPGPGPAAPGLGLQPGGHRRAAPAGPGRRGPAPAPAAAGPRHPRRAARARAPGRCARRPGPGGAGHPARRAGGHRAQRPARRWPGRRRLRRPGAHRGPPGGRGAHGVRGPGRAAAPPRGPAGRAGARARPGRAAASPPRWQPSAVS